MENLFTTNILEQLRLFVVMTLTINRLLPPSSARGGKFRTPSPFTLVSSQICWCWINHITCYRDIIIMIMPVHRRFFDSKPVSEGKASPIMLVKHFIVDRFYAYCRRLVIHKFERSWNEGVNGAKYHQIHWKWYSSSHSLDTLKDGATGFVFDDIEVPAVPEVVSNQVVLLEY